MMINAHINEPAPITMHPGEASFTGTPNDGEKWLGLEQDRYAATMLTTHRDAIFICIVKS